MSFVVKFAQAAPSRCGADCGWPATHEWTPPSNLKSGSYALLLQAGEARENIPFFVVPAVGKPRANIQIERIAHLRTVDLQDNNVAGRTFNDEGIRRGHGDRPRGMTSGPYLADRGPGRLFAARLFAT